MENRTDKRAQRGGLPLLFALILGLSLLLHTAGMLAMGGWHGIADPAFLKGDLSRYPEYARAMADLYRAVAVCAAGAGDAMGQPTDGELTIVNRSEAQLFDGAVQKETDAPAGSYWQVRSDRPALRSWKACAGMPALARRRKKWQAN